jgi:hypothetical protein
MLCREMKIDPKDLLPKELNDFKEKGESEFTCEMKFHNYERKRLSKFVFL